MRLGHLIYGNISLLIVQQCLLAAPPFSSHSGIQVDLHRVRHRVANGELLLAMNHVSRLLQHAELDKGSDHPDTRVLRCELECIGRAATRTTSRKNAITAALKDWCAVQHLEGGCDQVAALDRIAKQLDEAFGESSAWSIACSLELTAALVECKGHRDAISALQSVLEQAVLLGLGECARSPIYARLAFSHYEIGEASVAAQYYERALAAADSIDGCSPTYVAQALVGLSMCYRADERWVDVESLLLRAESLTIEHSLPRYDSVCTRLGYYYMELNRDNEALEYFLKSYESPFGALSPSQSKARALVGAARIALRRNALSSSEHRARQAIALLKKYPLNTQYFMARAVLATVCFRQGRRVEAMQILETDLRRSREEISGRGVVLAFLARQLWELGEIKKADKLLDESVKMFEHQVNHGKYPQVYLASYREWNPFTLSAYIKYERGFYDAAFARLDQGNGRLSTFLMSDQRSVSEANERSLLSDIRSRLLDQRTALVTWYDRDRTWDGRPRADHLGIVVRHEGAVQWRRLAPSSEWTETDARLPITYLDEVISGHDLGKWREIGRELYAQRFAPLMPLLAGIERVIVVPTGSLMEGVSVETLPVDGWTTLGDMFAVQYAPSARFLLCESSRSCKPSRGVLAMGFAGASGNVESSILQFAPNEASSISSMIPESRALVGAAATKAAFLSLSRTGELAQYQFVHFASHAIVDDMFPANSYISLKSAPEDGGLTQEELSESDMCADVVVLSGCRTGLGRYRSREGLLGMAHACYKAGAQAVVASLWDADDAATAVLMEQFYKNVAVVDPVRALQRAKIYLQSMTLKQLVEWCRAQGSQLEATRLLERRIRAVGPQKRPFQHPKYWGNFVFIGRNQERL